MLWGAAQPAVSTRLHALRVSYLQIPGVVFKNAQALRAQPKRAAGSGAAVSNLRFNIKKMNDAELGDVLFLPGARATKMPPKRALRFARTAFAAFAAGRALASRSAVRRFLQETYFYTL